MADAISGALTNNPRQLGAGVGGLLGEAFAGALRGNPAAAGADPRAEQRRIEYEKAVAARRQEKADRLDQVAFQRMSLLDAPFNPVKPVSTDSRTPATCDGSEGQFVCHVVVCGGAMGGPSVCCPAGFPKLNECDCQCYAAAASFECKRFAACNYSLDVRPPPAAQPLPDAGAGK